MAQTITSQVSERLSCDLGSTSHTKIELSGPFVLPQLMSGGLHRVDVNVNGIPVSGSTADVAVTLHGVDLGDLFASDDERKISVGSGNASAQIGYKALGSLISEKLGGAKVGIVPGQDVLRISVPGQALSQALTDALSDALGSGSKGSSSGSSSGSPLESLTGISELASIGLGLLGGGGADGAWGKDSPISSILDMLGQGGMGSRTGAANVPAGFSDIGAALGGLLGGTDQLGSLLSFLSGKTVSVDLGIAGSGKDITIAPQALRLDDQEISLKALSDVLGNIPQVGKYLKRQRFSISQLPGFINLTSLSATSSGLAVTADINQAKLEPDTMGAAKPEKSGSSCKP